MILLLLKTYEMDIKNTQAQKQNLCLTQSVISCGISNRNTLASLRKSVAKLSSRKRCGDSFN